MFTKDTLFKTWIPTVVVILPANLIAAHFLGTWGVVALTYGFLAFGALLMWDSYYDLRKARGLVASVIKNMSQEEVDKAVKDFSKYDHEAAKSITKELFNMRSKMERNNA